MSLLLLASPAAALAATRNVCPSHVSTGYTHCMAKVIADPSGLTPLATTKPTGYSPADFDAAYGNRGTSTATIGVVSAYDAPNLVADVANYSKQYRLPALAICKTAAQTSCIAKYGQTGSTRLPAISSSWAVETSLDTEMVHAMCPGCRVDVVEASSASMSSLGTAANEAAKLGASVVSNSYGGVETGLETKYDSDYAHADVTSVVSSGDDGYGVSYPASSPDVVAVGGTTLAMANGHVTSETAWNGAGSGCSKYEPKPSWQKDTACFSRSVADISADADPNTGAAVYDSYRNEDRSGWYNVGGTSLAAPLVAGIIANSGHAANYPQAFYSGKSIIRDIVSGTNGSCSVTYLCRAGSGYDGPTGLGVLSQL